MAALDYDAGDMKAVFDAEPTVFRTLLEAHGRSMVEARLRDAIADLKTTAPTP